MDGRTSFRIQRMSESAEYLLMTRRGVINPAAGTAAVVILGLPKKSAVADPHGSSQINFADADNL
jgi:hypothetical protein